MPLKFLSSSVASAIVLVAMSASAKPSADKAACVAAHDKAQAARAGRNLIESRASFVTCSSETCPDMIRDDCSKGLREVDEALPTLVLSASVDGKDVTDAVTLLDGNRLSNVLDGRAVPVDPGPHVARFERQGNGAVEVRVIAREGEKNRLVTGTFVLAQPAAHAEGKEVKTEGGSRFPFVPAAFAAGSLLSLGTALFMHVDMTNKSEAMHSPTGCAAAGPNCSQYERDGLSEQLVLRNVAFGVGLGALAVAAVTYVVAYRR
jgi:hypothetical protein